MRTSRRTGFTLPEVLVTIAIVATLAAVLLPALNGQLSKGEASRVSNDLLAVQSAVNTFVSDVRRYPGDLVHLTSGPITGLQDINSVAYPAVLAAKWRGPYLSKELIGGNFDTGFGAKIIGDLDPVLYNGINYVTVEMTPITQDDFNKVDQIIDEVVSSTSGQLRWSVANSGTATYFAVPVQ